MGDDDSVWVGHIIKCFIETKTQILALILVPTFGSEKGLQESFWSCLIFFFLFSVLKKIIWLGNNTAKYNTVYNFVFWKGQFRKVKSVIVLGSLMAVVYYIEYTNMSMELIT